MRRLVAGGAMAVVIGGVVAAASADVNWQPPPRDNVDYGPAGAVRLVSFDSCETALSGFQRAALPNVTPFGIFGDAIPATGLGAGGIADAVPAAPGAASGPVQQMPKGAQEQNSSASRQGGAQTPGHSKTNTHEAGVDEPDIVKTDGKRLLSVMDGKLKVVDVASRKVTGTLEVPDVFVTQMLIAGDRALLVASQNSIAYDMPGGRHGKPGPGSHPGMGSKLVLVDLAGTPRILGTLAVDGVYLDARQVGNVARVVLRSRPQLKFVYPDGTRSNASSYEENRSVVMRSTIDEWLPRYELDSDGAKSAGRLVGCERVSHPAAFSATSMLTVLTLDLTRVLGTGDPVTVAADGDTVYGSGTSLYIADDHRGRIPPRRFLPNQSSPGTPVPQPSGKTQIHRFDVAGSGPPRYAGSGEVEGTLLNQYSLSEHNGHLRVATTVGTAGGFVPDRSPSQSHSMVTVLARGENALTEVGRVDGLGKGERIYAVRFVGSVGYVVTFRQTDPLYTVDLSQPSRPRVVGELKITGYSAYLHPVGDNKVLGVGQEASEQGRRLGAQVSLFDIGNLATPNRVAQYQVEGGMSDVEYDPHAFLYWPERNLVVIPVIGGRTAQSPNRGYRPNQYALVLRVENGKLTEAGRVTHASVAGLIRRSLVIGNDLWTVSDGGIAVNDLDKLEQKAWIALR